MGNETDPPDAPAPKVPAIVEDAAAVVVDDRAPADDTTTKPTVRLPKIEGVTPDRSPPPSPPARRSPGQIVQLGRPKTKSYVN